MRVFETILKTLDCASHDANASSPFTVVLAIFDSNGCNRMSCANLANFTVHQHNCAIVSVAQKGAVSRS